MKELYFLVKARKGERNRYVVDKERPELESVLPSQLTYPESYGIVAKTYCDDGKPLDGFVLVKEAPPIGCVVKAKPVGVLRTKKEGRRDQKIVCAALKDEDYNEIDDLEMLPDEKLEEMADFLETHGYLNDREVNVESLFGAEKAEKLLKHSRKLYKRKSG